MLAKLPLGDPRYRQVMAELERIATQNHGKAGQRGHEPECGLQRQRQAHQRRLDRRGAPARLRDQAGEPVRRFPDRPCGGARNAPTNKSSSCTWFPGPWPCVKQNGPVSFGGAITIQIVTNLRDESRVYLSLGPTIAATKPGAKGAGAELHREFGIMIFPHSAFEEGGLDKFTKIEELGLELGFDIARFNDLFGRYRAQLARLECIKDTADKLPQRARKSCKWDADIGVAISFSPKVFKDPRNNIPGFGLSFAPHRTSGKIGSEESRRGRLYGRLFLPAVLGQAPARRSTAFRRKPPAARHRTI